jgi:hypothetical protein
VNSSKLLEQTDPPQAALKYTMADAPTTTRTKTRIKMAGSTTTSSALPVVVASLFEAVAYLVGRAVPSAMRPFLRDFFICQVANLWGEACLKGLDVCRSMLHSICITHIVVHQ